MKRGSNLLEVHSVTKRFGGLIAVDQLTFELGEGEVVGLIGPNGSGKTVTVNLCSAIYAPDEGYIRFRGVVVNNLRPWDVYKLGLARSFQITRLWPRMTVVENVVVGCANVLSIPTVTKYLSGFKTSVDKQMYDMARRALEIVGMSAFATKRVGDLSFGQQRLVELARVIASRPRCALLDEPAAGLKPELVDQLGKLILRMNHTLGISFLIVEHRTRLVMDVCSRIIVLNYGRKIAEGPPSTIVENEEVVSAYLGKAQKQETV